jgi:type IV pilus assembly protein PilB
VTSALDCVLAQRLARRLCERCKEPYQPSEAELRQAGWSMDSLDEGDWPTLHRHIGCEACGRTGYRGRFGLHEVMPISEAIERMVIEKASTDDLNKTAVMEGMITLREDGLRKAAMGQTSLEEVFRVVA